MDDVIRTVPHYPKPGIIFYITTLLIETIPNIEKDTH